MCGSPMCRPPWSPPTPGLTPEVLELVRQQISEKLPAYQPPILSSGLLVEEYVRMVRREE